MQRKLPIFYSAIMLTGVNLLLRFVSTTFHVYVSGKIGASGVGLLQLVMSVGGLSMTMGMAGIRTATMYLTAEEIGKNRPQNITWVLSGCFIYSILISGAVALLLYFSSPFLAAHWVGIPKTATAIRLYACIVPINCLCGVLVGYFTAANRIGTLSIIEIIEQILSIAITTVFLIFWANTDSVKACQSIILGSGTGCMFTLICLTVLRIKAGVQAAKPIPVKSRILKAAVPLAIADDLKAGISTTENLLVPKRLALYPHIADPLASFGIVCGMVFPILMFPAAIIFSLAELLIPELARCSAAQSKKRISYLAKRSLHITLLYGTIFCGLEFLLADTLMLKLYKNSEAGQLLRLYAPLIPMLYCDAITDGMIKGLGKQKDCVRYNIITSSLDVLFLYLLLPKYGMKGYFFSFFITHLLNFILSINRLRKLVGNLISFQVLCMTAVSTISAVFIVSHVRAVALKGFLFLLIHGCLLYIFNVIGKSDFYWIKGLIKKNNPSST